MVRPRFASALRELQRQEPASPHRGLRCPPGTYFSSRSLRSNLSDLEENAVLEHKVRPRHRAQPPPTPGISPPAEGPHPSNGPSNKPGMPRTHHRARGLTPPGSVHEPVRRILEVQPARATSRTPTRPLGPPPPHMSGVLLSDPPRTPPAKCRPRLTRQPPFPFPGVPESAAPHPWEPRFSGGTSGRYWAASAGSLCSYRRPSGRSLWDSWTPCPTCGVCVTTTLPQCPNGARDR